MAVYLKLVRGLLKLHSERLHFSFLLPHGPILALDQLVLRLELPAEHVHILVDHLDLEVQIENSSKYQASVLDNVHQNEYRSTLRSLV